MVWAKRDITANDGGSKKGEEDMVVVIRERITVVRGNTDKGGAGADDGDGGSGGVGMEWEGLERVTPEGVEARLMDEWRVLADGTRRRTEPAETQLIPGREQEGRR